MKANQNALDGKKALIHFAKVRSLKTSWTFNND